MNEEYWKNSPFGENSIFHPDYDKKIIEDRAARAARKAEAAKKSAEVQNSIATPTTSGETEAIYYYNLSGVMVKSVPNASNLIVIVFTTSNNETDMLTAIKNNKTINLPSQEVMDKTNKIIELTDDYDYEHGFVVATDGTTSTIEEGYGQSVPFDPGYDELQRAGKTTSFDVHTHNENIKRNTDKTIHSANDYNPSGIAGNKPTGDYYNRSLQEAEGDVKQPSWVIGTNTIVNGAENKKPVKIITFYNSKGQVHQMNWNIFQTLINNITIDFMFRKVTK